MQTLSVGPSVQNASSLFEFIADELKIGQSKFDGWDQFYDIFFNYLDGSGQVIQLQFSTNLAQHDWDKFLGYMQDLNEDLRGQAEVVISGSNKPPQ